MALQGPPEHLCEALCKAIAREMEQLGSWVSLPAAVDSPTHGIQEEEKRAKFSRSNKPRQPPFLLVTTSTAVLDEIEACSPPQAPHLDQVKMHCATTATLLLRNVFDFTRDVACLSEATVDLSQHRCF